MKLFEIHFQATVRRYVSIEAKSEAAARKLFESGDYPDKDEREIEITDVEITKVEEIP